MGRLQVLMICFPLVIPPMATTSPIFDGRKCISGEIYLICEYGRFHYPVKFAQIGIQAHGVRRPKNPVNATMVVF
jgi:hypothetical protein